MSGPDLTTREALAEAARQGYAAGFRDGQANPARDANDWLENLQDFAMALPPGWVEATISTPKITDPSLTQEGHQP